MSRERAPTARPATTPPPDDGTAPTRERGNAKPRVR